MFDTFARNVVGLQPIFVAVTSDAIAWPGVATMNSVSAPFAFSARICCVTV